MKLNRSKIHLFTASCVVGGIIYGCQNNQNPSLLQQTQSHKVAIDSQIQNDKTNFSQAPIGYGLIQTEDNPNTHNQNAKKARIDLELILPQMTTGSPSDFSVQALAINNIAKIKLELTGPGITTPIFVNGADANGKIANIGGSFSVAFSNVPYGNARRISLQAYDSNDVVIPGASIKTAFNVSSSNSAIELNFKTSPLADILEAIGSSPANKFLTENLNLSSLQSFVNTLTGLTGTAPNYTYTTHPSLIVGSTIAADLIANGGNIGSLVTTKAAYKITPGNVSMTLSGLITPDTASVSLRDPASKTVINLANGVRTITGVKPGSWQVQATATGYTATTPPTVNVTPGGTVNAGTINFVRSVAPVISSLSSNDSQTGSSIQINGSNFHSTIAGNTVDFSGTIGTITAASTNQLTVTVPAGMFGSKNIKVTVGGQVSNLFPFSVRPNITSLSVNNGLIGSVVQISGTGFANLTTNNIVKLGTVNASVSAASSTQLSVAVPNAPNGSFSVQVGSAVSNTSAIYNVRPNISWGSPVNSSKISGVTSLTSNPVSGNPISKVEYFDGATLLGQSTVVPYSFNWNTTLATTGNHTLSAKITDSQGNVATSNSVTVLVNQKPIINTFTGVPNPMIGLGHPLKLSCQATDSDNTLTSGSYNWSTVGGSFGSFSATTGTQVYWTAPNSAGGPYTIRCSVNDGVNTPTTQDLSVTVSSGNKNLSGNGGLF